MIIRKRTRCGKSQNMKIQEPLRVIAREEGKSVTMNFELQYYGTEFNITLTRGEADSLIKQLKESTKNSEAKDGE